MNRVVLLALSASLLTMAAKDAAAHPHVFVSIRSEVVFGPDGAVTAIRHAWTFDDAFSSFATQGLDTNKDGKLSREELAALAEVNVSSLKDFDYFTVANADGKKTALKNASDYFLEHKDGALTLHFTLNLEQPQQAKSVDVDVADPTYFVSFSFNEKDPVKLAGAPAGCKIATVQPPAASGQSQRLSESFYSQLNAQSSYGSQFANRMQVKC